jgi:DSF synthase
LIAEKGCKMGFPEILFNLFPGMGALTLLGRRVGMAKAEQMILSGNLYRAEDFHEMGVVDVLAEPGEGPQAVYDYVRRDAPCAQRFLALRAARELVQPISYDELMSDYRNMGRCRIAHRAKGSAHDGTSGRAARWQGPVAG